MYTTYFLIGFVTSFGWWSAGKIQKIVDPATVTVTAPIASEVSGKTKPENIDNPLASK